ncbi:CBY1-interacting BAR domain-containing protein 1-like [Uloborus diversus]|uniref:CBY1-interacting BAR domain-containing protein 1-like n=1 Tax=Uloborus diversus TaxID=327109 RepID=UPI0024091196|nr:CBY1-interacting BAR domain-containing protein 1-like [Uloborus diversus]
MSLDLRSSELEYSFLKERISSTEKHISAISYNISSYLAQQAHVRDSGDKLAKTIDQFGSKETLNRTLRAALAEFSDILSTVQEYRETQIRRTEAKVVVQLSKYDNICKLAKDDLKKCCDARSKELKKQNCLEKARSKNPSNWRKIVEKEVSEAQDLSNRTSWNLLKQMDHFEKQKLEDMKNAFLEFIKIEMLFNCKCIELYTKAFNVVKSIDSEEDLKDSSINIKETIFTQSTEVLTSSDNIIITQSKRELTEVIIAVENSAAVVPYVKGISNLGSILNCQCKLDTNALLL